MDPQRPAPHTHTPAIASSHIPYHAQWDITFGCNFRCTFCLTSSGKCGPDELSTEQARELIDTLYEEGIWFLKVLGGEPFFRKDTLSLFRYAADKGMILSFSTNASLVSEEKARELSELRNSIIYTQMSLYGYDQETYGRVTGRSGNYERALKGLTRLVEADLDISVLTVATDENAGCISRYYDIARQYGASEFRLTPKIGLGRASSDELSCSRETPRVWSILAEELCSIREGMRKDDPEIILDARPLLAAFLSRKTGFESFYENCSAATTMIYIDPSGKASPCPFLKESPEELRRLYSHIGSEDLLRKSFSEVWESESFRTFRKYYQPSENLIGIEENCKFFRDGSCSPCVVTPCNCVELVRSVRKELSDSPHASEPGPDVL